VTLPHPPPRSERRIGDGLVVVLGLAMLVSPAATTLLGEPLDPIAMGVRAMVVGLALVTTWMPIPGAREWRRMMAVSIMAAHHVGVGVAAGMPHTLLVELLGGVVLTGTMACWLLPRAGFGILISATLAVGTVALGLISPPSDLGRLSVWAGVFLLGGIAAELSVWFHQQRRDLAEMVPERSPPPPMLQVGELVGSAGIGSARLTENEKLLHDPSEQLSQMTAPWGSAATWWTAVLGRGRNPSEPGVPTQIELLPPDGGRHSFRLRVVHLSTGERHLLVEEITTWVAARREVTDLKTRLEHLQSEALNAREARERALRSRSHNLRTPLHNLKTNLHLMEAALDDNAPLDELRAELDRAKGATHQMVREVNSLLDGMVRGDEASRDALIDVVVVVDTALDDLASVRKANRCYGRESLPIRGPRAELTTLIRDLVKAAVGAATQPVEVLLFPTLRGFVHLSFDAEPADEALLRMVLRTLAARVATVGGEVDLDGAGPPSIFIPEDRSKARGVEAEVTWPGVIPLAPRPPSDVIDKPSPGSRDQFSPVVIHNDEDDDEPTHLLRVRDTARLRPRVPGDDNERLG